MISMGFLDASRSSDELELVTVPGNLLFDGVDQIKSTAGVLPLVLRGIDPDGEELGA
jgi:hypothetical protein